jgi:hypothetical protein
MKKFLVVLFLFSTWPSLAQTPVISKSGPYIPLGFCQITSLSTSTPLTSASCAVGSVPNNATIAEICVETAGVRYRDDPGGTAPTSSVGIPVIPVSGGSVCYAYAIAPLTQARFIAVSGSPVMNISFYR